MQQASAGSIKNHRLKVGERLIFKRLIPGEIAYSKDYVVPNDSIFCYAEKEGRNKKISVREFFKMTIEGDEHFHETESGKVKFPAGVEIVSMKNRLDQDNNPIYPLAAYKLVKEFIDAKGSMSWSQLVEGGTKDGHTFDPVQDYTVKLI